MKVIIIGCDRLGAELAQRLSQHGHEIAVVDLHRSSFVRLDKGFRGRTHEGDALSEEVLLRAGIEDADAVIALTESEASNYVIGRAAKEIYNIPQVIVRSYESASNDICELMGLQAVSSSIWGAEQLEEMLSHKDLKSVFTVAGGEVEIYAITIPTSWENRPLGELLSENNGQRAISLTRSGNSFIPTQLQSLKEDDILHIAANHEGIEELRTKLNIHNGGGA